MAKVKQAPKPASMIDLVESLPLPVFIKGLDGRYLAVNKAWEEFFGIPCEKFLGKRVTDLYPQNPEIAQKHATMDRKLWEAPGGQSYEMPITAWGKPRETIYYKATFQDAGGGLAGLIGVIVDVTSRKRAEERLEAGFEHLGEMIALTDKDDYIVVANRRFREFNARVAEYVQPGRRYDEHLRAGAALGLFPGAVGREEEWIAERMAQRRNPTGPVERQRQDGRWLMVDDQRLPDGGAVTFGMEITERKRSEQALRESEAHFRQTFELAAAGIAHVVDGRFVRVNSSLCAMLGYPEERLVGASVKDISHPEDRDVTDAGRARIYAGEIDSARFDKHHLHADGAVVWAEVVVAQVRNEAGAPLYDLAIFHDITERKRAEVALREAHEELKRSNAELEQFAYVASHDLQEPLRMVSSYTQLVQRRYGERLDGDAREFMNYVVEGAAHMKRLIEDLLAYSRVGTRGKEFQPVDLEVPLRKALTNLRSAIEDASAAVTWDPLPTVVADDMQLAQFFQNLVGNALKFRSTSVPRVHISSKENENEWEIAVTDNGIGIAPQYFERIFMVFQRLHNRTEYAGTGIGLAICKKVVERHGGRLWVESKPGEGSTFRFTLPKGGEQKND